MTAWIPGRFFLVGEGRQMAAKAKKRNHFFETKSFGFIIGLIIVGIFFGISRTTTMLQGLELKVVDLHMSLKDLLQPTHIQQGVTKFSHNFKQSEDIAIIGIDFTTLSDYGRFPFPRYHYADLINAYSRIKNQDLRERAFFLDVFFVDMDTNAADDALLEAAIRDSSRVVLETVLRQDFSTAIDEKEYWERLDLLTKHTPSFTKVSGPWQKMTEYLGFEAPLKPFAASIKAFGHANFLQDPDDIYRRQQLITKISRLIEVIPLDSLNADYRLNESEYERLCWMDNNGDYHQISYPLTEKTITTLKKQLPKHSPPVVEDADNDGNPDASYFVVRKYKDYFIPAVTLALALEYFNKKPSDVEIVIGKHIRIPSPEYWEISDSVDAAGDSHPKGKWVPYTIQLTQDEYDANNRLIKPGKRMPIPEILIPIDKNGQMVINFMGKRSSESGEGNQTFPVRSFSVLANMVRPPDKALWRESMVAANKILMVGAFSRGMAQDEKPTPRGLMYGIEIHANSLNTILMNNFVKEVPVWVNLLILLALVALICFMSSRMPSIVSLLISIVLIIVFFFSVSILFDLSGQLVEFTTPALSMIFCFVSIIVYRAMTEEKDKKMLRDTFGKYVSPRVVDQLVQNPPELGGVDKELTVFFSDIRGFSTLSESMSPQDLLNHLNVYYSSMTDLILEYGGTLDKYIGDAIMAFWGAPLPMEDHANRACECALKQIERLKELNQSWPPEKRIDIGIGINSGVMVVGNMGSSLRMSYTLIGDNVNLGSRLEGTNKEYGTNIIISEMTYGLVKDGFIVRELDNVRVKGKNKPVGIYELVDSLKNTI
jgi:adenylate cyclase